MDTSAEQNTAFFRFEELRVYHKALDYINFVHDATLGFVHDTKDSLGIRFNEAARSIATNIAEGSSRNKSQFIYYLKMAKSSVREALVISSVSYNLKYLDDKQNSESRGYLMEMTKMIGALISSLQRSQETVKDSEDVEEDVLDKNDGYRS